jgi:hypothetical protein
LKYVLELIAVEKGFVTAEQVIEAMNIQILEDMEKREHRLIGTILLDQGILTISQIDEVPKIKVSLSAFVVPPRAGRSRLAPYVS